MAVLIFSMLQFTVFCYNPGYSVGVLVVFCVCHTLVLICFAVSVALQWHPRSDNTKLFNKQAV